jgi:hypothetical protein
MSATTTFYSTHPDEAPQHAFGRSNNNFIGPAPWPSSETEKQETRSLKIDSLLCGASPTIKASAWTSREALPDRVKDKGPPLTMLASKIIIGHSTMPKGDQRLSVLSLEGQGDDGF